jgi:hypothetical protein
MQLGFRQGWLQTARIAPQHRRQNRRDWWQIGHKALRMQLGFRQDWLLTARIGLRRKQNFHLCV